MTGSSRIEMITDIVFHELLKGKIRMQDNEQNVFGKPVSGENQVPVDASSAPAPQAQEMDPPAALPDAGVRQKQIKAMESALQYFKHMRGLANDFIFPASLLSELDDSCRKVIERAVIQRCNEGDARFFDALENVKTVHPMDAVDLTWIAAGDNDYSRRSRVLEALFMNTRDIRLLLILLKMAPPDDSMAFSRLAFAVQRTDWESMDTTSELHHLFLRALFTFTCVKREFIRRNFVYKRLCESNLKHGYRSKEKKKPIPPFLSLQDLAFFTKPDPWSDRKDRDPLAFYKALEKRALYLETKDLMYIQSMMGEALRYPEVYDVLCYMRQTKELDDSQFEDLCGFAG